MDPLRFPIGHFEIPHEVSDATLHSWIEDIAAFPAQAQDVTEGLSSEDLALRYRPDGWNIAQVVNHCADSHMNAIIRFKLALTEEEPTIRPYHEERWAELSDGKTPDLRNGLTTLQGVHARWTQVLRSLSDDQLDRTLLHPDFEEPWTIRAYVGNYAWHCRHHLAHIHLALKSKVNP